MSSPVKTADTVRPVMVQDKLKPKTPPSRFQKFNVPTQTPNALPGAPALNMNIFHKDGSWAEVEKRHAKLKPVVERIQALKEELVGLIQTTLPQMLNDEYMAMPEADCHFGDSPLNPYATGGFYQTLEAMDVARSTHPKYANMGTPESRVMPSIVDVFNALPGWIFRCRKKKGVSDLV